MIPLFPEFTAFKLSIKKDYASFYDKHDPHADYSFANLAIWLNLNSDLKLSNIRGNILLNYTDPFSKNRGTYALYGVNDIDVCLSEIYELQQNLGHRKAINVPGFLADKIHDQQKFVIKEDRDNWNYIYDTDLQTRLASKDLSVPRKKVRRYIREIGEHSSVRSIDLSEVENVNLIRSKLNTWKRVYDVGKNDEERIESHAINKALELAVDLEIECLGVFVDNILEGFALYHLEKNNFAIVGHIKTDYQHNNIYDFIGYCLASMLRTRGVKYMNFEQDLGIEGIRFHKTKKRPAYMLEEYIVMPLQH